MSFLWRTSRDLPAGSWITIDDDSHLFIVALPDDKIVYRAALMPSPLEKFLPVIEAARTYADALVNPNLREERRNRTHLELLLAVHNTDHLPVVSHVKNDTTVTTRDGEDSEG